MYKKVITQTLFGKPYDWMDSYFENCNSLGKYGWEWKFFMPEGKSLKHVEVIPMTIDEFDDLVEDKLGIHPENYIDDRGCPHKLMSDYYPAHGLLFDKWTKGADFWGHVNWDMVFGRLDKWITDEFLSDCDIFGNDPDAINGIFSLYRNNKFVNNLFKEHPLWKEAFTYVGSDNPYVFDETCMSELCRKVRDEGRLRFKTDWFMCNDHMEHQKEPKIKMLKDGSLIDTVKDEEVMIYHFSGTKKWPL